jgi:hypothetical protein
MEPGFDYSPEGVKKIAEHVTEFSLAALKHMRSQA